LVFLIKKSRTSPCGNWLSYPIGLLTQSPDLDPLVLRHRVSPALPLFFTFVFFLRCTDEKSQVNFSVL